jgi:hypothetical protein
MELSVCLAKSKVKLGERYRFECMKCLDDHFSIRHEPECRFLSVYMYPT